jgi:23S rRNA (uridine2552-2'-O)-methyltransferase
MVRRTGSSRRWLERQSRDPYVERATREGWRSRAAFKLLEIDEREKILKRGAIVVDLGAAPGGWSQVAARKVGSEGRVYAIDRLPMDPIPGVEIVEGDFSSARSIEELRRAIGDHAVDLVLSDLAPNISGNRAIDQPRILELIEDAMRFADQVLKPGGSFLVKLFQGDGQQALEKELRSRFGRLKALKPKASRAESREIYLLASGYRMV